MDLSQKEIVEYVVLDDNNELVRAAFCQRELLSMQGNAIEVPSGTIKSTFNIGEYPLDLTAIKVKKRIEINSNRDIAIEDGITVTLNNEEHVFDADPKSQAKLSGAALAGLLATQLNMPFEVDWTLKNNEVITLSFQQLANVILTGASLINSVHHNATTRKIAVDQAQTIGEVLNA